MCKKRFDAIPICRECYGDQFTNLLSKIGIDGNKNWIINRSLHQGSERALVICLSGQERIWFLVYDPAEQRKIDLHLGEFETVAIRAGKNGREYFIEALLPFMDGGNMNTKKIILQAPEYIVDQLEAEFIPYAIQFLKNELAKVEQEEHTLIALRDCLLFSVLPVCLKYWKAVTRISRVAYLFSFLVSLNKIIIACWMLGRVGLFSKAYNLIKRLQWRTKNYLHWIRNR